MPSISASALACYLLLSSLPFTISTTLPKAISFTSKVATTPFIRSHNLPLLAWLTSNRQFDDFPKTFLGALQPLPKPIYNDLFFGGWRYRSDLLFAFAQSKPNTITFGQLSKTTGATASITNITSDYPNSKVGSFALSSLYVACSVAATGPVPPVVPGVTPPSVGDPQPCTMKFSGTTAAGSAVSQECQYSGTVATNPVAQLCIFDQAKFGNVVTVVVEIVSALFTPALSAGVVDSVKHTNFY